MVPQRILFLVKERNVYGSKTRCYGLFNSCNFVSNRLNELGFESKTLQVIDNNCIDRVITEYKPTHCIIEALWVVPEKIKVLAKLHPSVNWIIRLHSASPFLAIEGITTQWLCEYEKLKEQVIKITISANHSNCVDDLKSFLKEVIYLPNIYYPKDVNTTNNFPKFDNDVNIIKIGCFGALRPLKNHFKQALLAIKFANKQNKILHFFINKSEHETELTNSVLKNIEHLFKNHTKHKLITIPWYEHGDFLEIVKQMDIGMQLSFTETFNIVAADFVTCGVPIVTSNSIDWISDIYQADINNDNQILEKMDLAYYNKQTASDTACLVYYNKQSEEKWLKWLKLLK